MAFEAKKAIDCACFNLRKATRAITSFYDEALQDHDITTPQFSILALLQELGESKITPLADQLVMDRTTLTRNLDRLEDRDLIEATPGEDDRRTRVVRLTPKGKDTLKRAFPDWRTAQEHIIDHLGDETFSDLLEILGRIPGVKRD